MTLEDKVHAFRLHLFRRAQELRNVSAACISPFSRVLSLTEGLPPPGTARVPLLLVSFQTRVWVGLRTLE